MNNAPWWFLLVTALVAGAAAICAQLVSAHITSDRAEKRMRDELKEERERLDAQLEHQRDIERKKRLHDQRTDLYYDVAETMVTLTTLRMTKDKLQPENDAHARYAKRLIAALNQYSVLITRVMIVGTPEIIVPMHRFLVEVQKPAGGIDFAALQGIHTSTLLQMRRDLEVMEEATFSNFRELTTALARQLKADVREDGE